MIIRPEIEPYITTRPETEPRVTIRPEIEPHIIMRPEIEPHIATRPEIEPGMTAIRPEIVPRQSPSDRTDHVGPGLAGRSAGADRITNSRENR